MHASSEMLPIWALDSETCLGQPGRDLICPINTVHSDAVPIFHVVEMAEAQHGHLCQDLCTRFVHTAEFACFEFAPCSTVDKCPLLLFHKTT
jgi:hypothetical protein